MNEALKVTFEDGQTEELTVRTLRVAEFPKAFAAAERENEPALLAIACDRPEERILQLSPDSYADVAQVFQERNASFFGYFARRLTSRGFREVAFRAAAAPSRGGSTSHNLR